MMYPVLTKVRYEDMAKMRGDRQMFGVSLFLSWVVGPALMFALEWLVLVIFNGIFQVVAYALLGWALWLRRRWWPATPAEQPAPLTLPHKPVTAGVHG